VFPKKLIAESCQLLALNNILRVLCGYFLINKGFIYRGVYLMTNKDKIQLTHFSHKAG
jgi:hypothetical protein